MEHASRGAAALLASDSLSAVNAFTQALIQHPTSPDYFVQRSVAFTRLKAPLGPRYDLALKDAEYAVLLGQKRAKRDKIQAGQQRRVIALFGLGRYGDAGFILQTMLKWRTSEKKDKMEGDIWNAKVEQKSKGLPADDERMQVTVKEYPEFGLPSEQELKKLLQGQLKTDRTFRFDGNKDVIMAEATGPTTNDLSRAGFSEVKTEISSNGVHMSTDEMPVKEMKVDTAKSNSTTSASAPIPVPQTITKLRHEWYQNAQSVTITIYAKGVKKDQAEIDIQNDSVSVAFPHPQDLSSTFVFTLDPLFALIDPAASTSSIMSTKVEFNLRKRVPGHKWPALEGDAPLKDAKLGVESSAAKAAIMSDLAKPPISIKPESAPSYPTSSKSGPKNWDKLATDLTTKKKKTKTRKGKNKENDKAESSGEDEEIDSDYDTGDAVDGFFKKLYAGADPDTRRAMMKSFSESNGTSLSTNWNEVGKGRVDPVKSKDDD